MQQFSGTTTNALVQIADINGGGDGLTYFGTVRNTGANSLTLSIVVTDYFGASDTLSPTVAATGFQKFDTISFSFGANTHPPFQRITVSIQSTTAGSATTYQLFAAEF